MSFVFPVQSEVTRSCSYTCTCVLLRQCTPFSTFVLRGKGRCSRALPFELTKYAGQQFVSMSCRGDTALWCPRLKWFEQRQSECGHALANMFVERVFKVQCAVSVCVRVCAFGWCRGRDFVAIWSACSVLSCDEVILCIVLLLRSEKNRFHCLFITFSANRPNCERVAFEHQYNQG